MRIREPCDQYRFLIDECKYIAHQVRTAGRINRRVQLVRTNEYFCIENPHHICDCQANHLFYRYQVRKFILSEKRKRVKISIPIL